MESLIITFGVSAVVFALVTGWAIYRRSRPGDAQDILPLKPNSPLRWRRPLKTIYEISGWLALFIAACIEILVFFGLLEIGWKGHLLGWLLFIWFIGWLVASGNVPD
jgi:hypothetical protein